MIEQELGLSLVELFSEISSEPVAAAFLGQVHLLCHFGNFFFANNCRDSERTCMYFSILDFIPFNLEFLSLKHRIIKLGFAKQDRLLLSKCKTRQVVSLDILILRFMAGLIQRAGKFNADLQVKL